MITKITNIEILAAQAILIRLSDITSPYLNRNFSGAAKIFP
jgi:hypothetical protein